LNSRNVNLFSNGGCTQKMLGVLERSEPTC
jgi:hypothetical protein